MADNYIEKQYEQYEARKAAWKKASKYGKKRIGILSQPANKQKKDTLATGGMIEETTKTE